MQIPCFLLRSSLPARCVFLTKHFGFRVIPSVLECRHPALEELPADEDIPFYRRHKAAMGALVLNLENELQGTLVDDRGDGIWRIKNRLGFEDDVSAYSLSLGQRTTDYFTTFQRINTSHGRDAFAWVWPMSVTHTHIRVQAPNRPMGVSVDKGLSVRDVYNTGYQRYRASSSPGDEETAKYLQTDADGVEYVEVGRVRIDSDRDEEDVPFLVPVSDAVVYGQSWVPQPPRTHLPVSYAAIAGILAIVGSFGQAMFEFSGPTIWYKYGE
ncbi:hypothetical protein DIPPA_30463 [Diplonema papillatum]|nr:hypothetical protein DIPPA_30463 [Diplonema papillatum]